MPRLASLLPALPLLLSLSSSVLASPAPHHLSLGRRHHSKRAVSDVDERNLELRSGDEKHQLTKRGYSGRATFFAVGLGACGNYNQDSDYIVALNQPQYEATGGSWCGKTITISYGGKSTQAQIQDECPGCPWGALDMSPSLFKFFADESVGVFYMSWTLGGGDPDPKPTTQWKPPPEPTTTWKPSPTTTWKPDPTTTWTPTSTWKPTPTSSAHVFSASLSKNTTLSSSSALNGTSHSSTSLSPAQPSSSASAAAAADDGEEETLPAIGAQPNADGSQSAQAYEKGNLDTLAGLVVRLGQIVVQGAKAASQQ